VCGQKSGRRRYKELPCWTDGINEVVRGKNNVWRNWFKERRDKKDKQKRLDRAVECMIKSEKRRT
jgi:hypothetical protein